MDDAALFNLCSAIAQEAHLGQVDQAGEPYIGHPTRVAARLSSTREKCVAILHDVIEDSSIDAEELLYRGVPADIVGSVRVVTKQSYGDFIGSVRDSGDPVAIAVKRADIADNLDPSRPPLADPAKATKLREKYENALRILDA